MFSKFKHVAACTVGAAALVMAGMGPAAAATEKHTYDYGGVDCNTYAGVEYCHDVSGQSNAKSNPGGRALIKDRSEATFTEAVDGEIVYERQFTSKEMSVYDIPRQHVGHTVEKGTIVTADGECRYRSVYHSANSELRASHYKTKCDR